MSLLKLPDLANKADFAIGVGPTSGALIAWGFYRIIKMLEYEMANPGEYLTFIGLVNISEY